MLTQVDARKSAYTQATHQTIAAKLLAGEIRHHIHSPSRALVD